MNETLGLDVGNVTQQMPDEWPAVMCWPPSASLVQQAKQSRRNPGRQMRLFGRPAFILDGVALSLIVELTGHLDLVKQPRPQLFTTKEECI